MDDHETLKDGTNPSSDARDQEQPVERRPYANDPTRVENTRVSDASTITAGGLSGGRPEGGATETPERARYEESRGDRDVRSGRDAPLGERAREGENDPVLPADDSTLNTKI